MRTTRRGLIVAGGVAAFPVGARAAPRSDGQVLEELLGLERRLEEAYDAALRRDAVAEGLGRRLLEQEREHARGLELLLNARGRRSPEAFVRDPGLTRGLRDRQAFARYALDLERRAVQAYVAAAAGVGDGGVRERLGAIMASEAQHEVALRDSLGEPLLGV